MFHQLLAFVIVDRTISFAQIKRQMIPVVLQVSNRLTKLTLRENIATQSLADNQLLHAFEQGGRKLLAFGRFLFDRQALDR